MSAPLQAALLKAIPTLDDTTGATGAMKVKGIMDDYVPPAAELKA
ncbi:hypothetical protein Hypma_012324, partial [Hypsizygus marmoreus]